jgi:general L-amino acid transport system substrate-binding protein
MRNFVKYASALAVAVGTMAAVQAPAVAGVGDTLRAVKERGSLRCSGHNGSYLGFAETDDRGAWKGYDIDLCRAVATAIFGDYEGHLEVVPVGWAQRFPSLQSGDLDIVIKASGWTFGRDTDLNLQYTQPYLLAPMRMMVHAESGIKDIKGLEGGSICVPAGTSNERYMADYMARTGLKAEIVAIERTEELDTAYLSGRCDGYHQWDVVLGTVRLKAENPDDHILLPEIIAAEPIGMIARQGDDNWVDIGNWVINALLIAEEAGVTSENVDEMRANPPSPAVSKLLGVTPGIGKQLGLDDNWGYNVIKRLGNTSQIWERNLGSESPYKIDRGMNALFRDGGVFYTLILD